MKKTLRFLSDLENNNNKDWFEENRSRYKEARQEFIQFITEVITGLAEKDPSLQQIVDPKKCVFRINRDIRFSKDKTPYKTNFAAAFSEEGKAVHQPGFYISIKPGNSMVGGGIWLPEPQRLQAIRQEIDYNGDELKKIINNPDFKNTFGQMEGERLKNPPKGYDKENPQIELLKYKSFVASTTLDDKDLTSDDIKNKTISVLEKLIPFKKYFDVALD
ncbi:DUF2461 domain-containing protein [Marinigracilibium pacificum]|uniref:DUF2461 domain-containing protein n=1 Tax=Marinigracilibium pacificum TaxID=2729599 RepID=A0A848IV62_9BACT|nr:DUF2461 domain-containing protein [Marinigracilibium pacificum]NMM47175.1 DUF2461 domain-containing protein [Marinigracilibium pacificum]